MRIVLTEGADLAEAVEACLEHGDLPKFDGCWDSWESTERDYLHIRVLSRQAIDDLKERREEIFEKCRKNQIRIIIGAEPCEYYDFVSGDTFKVRVGSEWPGSVDDAATYCDLIMEKI